MDKNLRSEKLVQYLDGELTGQEKLEIERELAADIAFNQEYENLKKARAAIQYHGLQQKVSSIHEQMMKEVNSPLKKSRGRIIRYTIAVAASIILVVGGFILYNFAILSSEKVFSSNYQSYELITVRTGEIYDTIISPIESAYRNKDYKKVLSIKKGMDKLTLEEEFLSGMAALELKDNIKAIQSFKIITAGNLTREKPVLQAETDYYLSMAYIRNKDYDLALDELNAIKANPEHLYYEKVTQKLLRQVRMLKWR